MNKSLAMTYIRPPLEINEELRTCFRSISECCRRRKTHAGADVRLHVG